MREYTNSEIAGIIDEYIHNAKHRDILKDRFINGLTFEKLAEKHDFSVRQIKNIVYREQNKIFTKLKV